jgi:hypothetical protein
MMAQQVHTRQIAKSLGRTQGAVQAMMCKVKEASADQPAITIKRQQRRKTGASFFLS